ncbi:MAG: hypothetical protein H6622_09785 [Halobacteriovoraceae bacterium]|nr:hypothetical protein [Halobacteriovoraceae bacterium]
MMKFAILFFSILPLVLRADEKCLERGFIGILRSNQCEISNMDSETLYSKDQLVCNKLLFAESLCITKNANDENCFNFQKSSIKESLKNKEFSDSWDDLMGEISIMCDEDFVTDKIKDKCPLYLLYKDSFDEYESSVLDDQLPNVNSNGVLNQISSCIPE